MKHMRVKVDGVVHATRRANTAPEAWLSLCPDGFCGLAGDQLFWKALVVPVETPLTCLGCIALEGARDAQLQ